MKEVIELIAETLHYHVDNPGDTNIPQPAWCNPKSCKDHKDQCRYCIAEAILNFRYDCKDCEGRGKVVDAIINGIHYYHSICPTCEGTGLSPKKVLAVLAEKQGLPIFDKKLAFMRPDETYKLAQHDMITHGWRKTIEEAGL